MNKTKILVTGGDGRFAKILKKENKKLNLIFLKKSQCNILSLKSIIKNIKKFKPKILFHCAGLSRPMRVHYDEIEKTIDLNIIGTANVTKACMMYNIKMIYFSTPYVYPGEKSNYNEEDSVKPINNYAISKLGGECAVRLYKNSFK